MQQHQLTSVFVFDAEEEMTSMLGTLEIAANTRQTEGFSQTSRTEPGGGDRCRRRDLGSGHSIVLLHGKPPHL